MRTEPIRTCDRKLLADFLKHQLEEDDRLDFLFHLDECPNCWDEVYNATKATHPHYYKKSNSRKLKITDKELKRLEKVDEHEEEVFEVA